MGVVSIGEFDWDVIRDLDSVLQGMELELGWEEIFIEQFVSHVADILCGAPPTCKCSDLFDDTPRDWLTKEEFFPTTNASYMPLHYLSTLLSGKSTLFI